MTEKNGLETRAMKAGIFQGTIITSLGVIQKDIEGIKGKVECIPLLKRDNKEIKDDVKSLHGKVGKLSKKVYIISGTIALIVSIVLVIIKSLIK